MKFSLGDYGVHDTVAKLTHVTPVGEPRHIWGESPQRFHMLSDFGEKSTVGETPKIITPFLPAFMSR